MFAHATYSRTLPIMIALLWGAPMTLQASAAEVDTHSLTVRYSDLDLKTEAGATALHARIARAAKAVCGPADSRALADAERVHACQANALAAAAPAAETVVAAARGIGTYAAADGTIKVAGR
jgi:UrcA family protein